MGKRGQSEVGDGARDAVYIPLIDIADNSLRHPDAAGQPARGVDISDFLERFFVQGVAPRLMPGPHRGDCRERGVAHRFDLKWAFRDSMLARWLRLVAFLFGSGIKCNGHRQTLDNDPCVG